MIKKRIVIVGATSLIAEQAARIWVEKEAVHLTLIGRDPVKLERIAADLRVRGGASEVNVVEADFLDPILIKNTVDKIALQGAIDVALIAHGSLPSQLECQADLSVCHQALEINAVSPALYAEAFAHHLSQQNHGTLAIIGSVAGDRGRKSNYVYGAAKGLLTRYAQGLQHRFAGTPVKVVLINPGPTDTPMTAHLKAEGARLAPVNHVARQMVQAIDGGIRVAYIPRQWQIIMSVIRMLPAPIFNRLNI
jgi:decaprenylphospho-beta-D-erythro-pentofuranosid-2-ulose 2-reductase